VVLKDGSVLAKGTPHEVLTQPLSGLTYDVSVLAQPHPQTDCPLVVPLPQIHPIAIFESFKENIS